MEEAVVEKRFVKLYAGTKKFGPVSGGGPFRGSKAEKVEPEHVTFDRVGVGSVIDGFGGGEVEVEISRINTKLPAIDQNTIYLRTKLHLIAFLHSE